jgi:hypothetical protein
MMSYVIYMSLKGHYVTSFDTLLGLVQNLPKLQIILFKHKEKIYESGHSSRFWIV